MEFYEVIQKRCSVRHYKNILVEPEKLERIFEAVQRAPSACNFQPWRFIVLRSQDQRMRLHPYFHGWVVNAPIMVVALGNQATAWQRDGVSIHEIDVAIAVEHLILAATAEGLGTCWICAFDRKAVRKTLNLEPGWDPVAVVPLGYPDEIPSRTIRKSLGEIMEIL